MKSSGIPLIVAGAITMLASLTMDVSGGTLFGRDIVNIHRLGQQQNILLLGGVLFIAGIILYAAKPEATKSESTQAERVNLLKAQRQKFGLAVRNVWSAIRHHIIRTNDFLRLRLIVGMAFGLHLATIISIFFIPLPLELRCIFPIFTLIYSFRATTVGRLISNLALVEILFCLEIPIAIIAEEPPTWDTGMLLLEYGVGPIIFWLVLSRAILRWKDGNIISSTQSVKTSH